MVIAPQNHLRKHKFVDRKDHIQTFTEAVKNLGQKELNVLVYYGVAGIGKTSLRKELPKYLKKYNLEYQHQEVIWASIDLQLEKHREKSTFLVTLKNELKNNLQGRRKINFPAFEIAHAIYWKKANPEIPLRKENYLFFEGDNVIDGFFGTVDKIPYFQLVPAIARALKNVPEYLRKWWKIKGEAELSQLSEMEALEIEEILPYFWAQDLENYLEHTSESAVIFIDTYEALWENHRSEGNSRDEWIRKELIRCSPKKALWVICGKEALGWEEIESEWSEYLTQCEVKKLIRKYCMEYLEKQGITDKEIQEIIFKGSKGVPYYLELSVNTYVRIIENGDKPKPECFGKNYPEIADRFFRYLSPEEKNALNVLSIPHFWDYDLFEYLVKEFNTGYPTNNYEDLCSFSFIDTSENNKYQMHQLMKESLQKKQENEKPDSVRRIHKAIHEYYSNKLKENIDIKAITPEHELALTEAFYHAKEALETKDLINWFIPASDLFYIEAFWQLIAPMYEEILQTPEVKYGPLNPLVAITMNNLGEIYRQLGDLEKTYPLCKQALEIFEKIGLYYNVRREYKMALPLYEHSMIIENVMDPQHSSDLAVHYASTLNNIGLCYKVKGKPGKALPFYEHSLIISEKVMDPQHPDIAVTLSNIAGLYVSILDYEKATLHYKRAIKIFKTNLEARDQNPATIIKYASTLNGYAELWRHMRKYKISLIYHTKTLDFRKNKLGPKHIDVASSLHNLGCLYCDTRDYDKAIPLFEDALDIIDNNLGTSDPHFTQVMNNLIFAYGK